MQTHQQLTHIQGLRGIAIFLVVLFHLLPDICPSGYMGVDVFFVISGYFLLGKQLKREQDFRLLSFLKQRSQRLLLPYFALILLVIVASVVLFPALEMHGACSLFKACLSGTPNIFLDQLSGDYFSSNARILPLMHLWYMGVILQSLLLFSLLFFVWQYCGIKPKTRIVQITILGLISFTVALLSLLPISCEYSQNTYYWTSSRIWEFCLGGLLYTHTKQISATVSHLICASSLILLTACSFISLPNSAIGVLLGAACGAFLLQFGKNARPTYLLDNKFFVRLGDISFSLYLVHWPCICVAEYILLHQLTCREAALLLPLIWLLTRLFHFIIEKPRHPFALIPLSASLAWAAAIGIYYSNGLARYLHQEVNITYNAGISGCALPILPGQSPLWEGTKGIRSNQYNPRSAPEPLLHELGDHKHKISFVIIGDSHALDLACGMHLCGLEHGWHGLYLNSYIVPFWGTDFHTPPSIAPGNFFDKNKAALLLRWLQQHPEIRTVFITQYWSYRLIPHKTWDGQSIENNIIQARVAELRQFCRKVQECGQRIVLVTDAPKLSSASPRRDLSSYLMWHQKSPLPPGLRCSRAEYEKLNGLFNREMDAMEKDGLCHVLHREKSFFTTDSFVAYVEKKITHRDNHHLYPFGSMLGLSRNKEEIQACLSEE